MSDNELTNPGSKPPAPTEHAATWAGRVVAHKDHGPDLDAAAAIHEFHDHLPRAEAEEKAYKDYIKSQHTEASAHHLLGMKAAAAAGDMESARKHGLMYDLHSKALGHESVGPAHPSVQAHMEKNPGRVKFKPHRGDLFALDKKEEAVTKSELMHKAYVTFSELASIFQAAEANKNKESEAKDPNAWAKAELEAKKKYRQCFTCKKNKAEDMGSIAGRSRCQACVDKTAARNAANDKPTQKAELSPTKRDRAGRVVPCVCQSYGFPHRTGSGKCQAKH